MMPLWPMLSLPLADNSKLIGANKAAATKLHVVVTISTTAAEDANQPPATEVL
jgi:hypothetical protein